MKKYIYNVLLCVSASILLASCNTIGKDDRFIEVQKAEATNKKVLLVDFTGWRCVNCPKAAETAAQIVSGNDERVIAVSMHPDIVDFTDPLAKGPNFRSAYASDYLTKVALGSATTSLPTGMIDNVMFGGSFLQNFENWSYCVSQRLALSSDYSIELAGDTSKCNVKITNLNAATDNVGLMLWLLEDSIVAPQITQGSKTIPEYTHRHVFRKSLLTEEGIYKEIGQVDGSTDYNAEFELPTMVGKHFIAVAAVVRLKNETIEVLQVEEKIIK